VLHATGGHFFFFSIGLFLSQILPGLWFAQHKPLRMDVNASDPGTIVLLRPCYDVLLCFDELEYCAGGDGGDE
jgi:hypothetical protein